MGGASWAPGVGEATHSPRPATDVPIPEGCDEVCATEPVTIRLKPGPLRFAVSPACSASVHHQGQARKELHSIHGATQGARGIPAQSSHQSQYRFMAEPLFSPPNQSLALSSKSANQLDQDRTDWYSLYYERHGGDKTHATPRVSGLHRCLLDMRGRVRALCHRMQESDVQARTRCIQSLRDCTDICFQSVAYMGRGRDYARQLCELCAQICDACATECDRFRDDHCQRCANECRRCAEESRKMAGRVPAMA
jgi:hypothetical protein